MKKYIQVIKNTWDEFSTYRLNFIMWRLRLVISFLVLYFLWNAIIPNNGTLFGYSKTLMFTYVFGTFLIGSFVTASRSYLVGDEINNGNLSNYLLRPMSYFGYWFARDLGDKAMNLVFTIGELVVLFLLLHPPVLLQTNILIILFTLVASFLALLIYFLFNILLGLIGFWSPETWAPRFIFITLLGFFAGTLFPLDILPKAVLNIFLLTPFPYLVYFPVKLYLGQLSMNEIVMGVGVSIVWTALLYVLVKIVWGVGLKLYTAQGR